MVPQSPNTHDATTAPPTLSPASQASDHPASNLAISPSPPSRPRWRHRLRQCLWGSAFVGTAAVSAMAGGFLALAMPLPGWLVSPGSETNSLADLWQAGFRYRVERPVNLLVMGIDEVPDAAANSPARFSGRTDTLLLVRVNPDEQRASIMSIPRDTRVEIPAVGLNKINHANVVGGPELVARTISYNLGPIAIDRYVRINTSAFRELVDLVGGVDVFVPKRMVYQDRSQGLTINLQPGWQTLNGDQAEQFARFRQDAQGDIGRVQRQQMLLKALRQRLTSPTVIPRLPQAIRIAQRHVDTNLTLEEMLALANFVLTLEPEQLQMVMLPGHFSNGDYNASYWIPDLQASAKVMDEFFQSSAVALLSHQESTSVRRLRIAVQNASGDPDIGGTVANYLRDQGFQNVYVTQNWPDPLHRTEVIAQRGDLDSADILTSVLGMGRVVSESTGDLQSDLTIRVGEDWVDATTVQDSP
ncbi:Putative transcriptional regulator YvhJ [Halomicronema hongdechloris C2206]|uniref:Transcriptional regulator YvhJ n=1 Tax=Halomicronema hongdechloris C2206 TaxID=1641165 RepID=A0A1Z3HRQ8_9CYAN|nr:LCP family protein [Halomicronema hongdechloris]ASC73000.1 Putative transcriptional regulator YvhJ [Halomicronema hongdechloris C2206]